MKNKQTIIIIATITVSAAFLIFILIPDCFKEKQETVEVLRFEKELKLASSSLSANSQAVPRAEREDYLKQNISSLSEEKEVLGGKFFVTNISWPDDSRAFVEYEDGHIALRAEAIFEYGLKPVSFTILKDDQVDVAARIFSPESGALIVSPLSVKGEAPGSWFFEASLRLRLVDDKGNIIASSWAQAGSDWMTESYVPYEGSLEFVTESKVGELVVLNDNPSGLPENEVFVKIPVRFK